mgnify:CR=1 FL=1
MCIKIVASLLEAMEWLTARISNDDMHLHHGSVANDSIDVGYVDLNLN